MVFVLAIGVIWQIIDLQFTQKEKYVSISRNQSTKWREIQASRGNIYSDDGSLLATSIPKYEIRMDTRVDFITNEYFFKHLDQLASKLSGAFPDKSPAEWRNYLADARRKGERYLLLKRDVDYATAKDMESWPIFNLGKYKGGFIKIEKFRREIPFGILAMRSIGYTNQSGTKIGLEGSYDTFLSGTVGRRLEQRIYGGVWKPVDNSAKLEPRNGFDVYTTLDINIQDVAESALKECLIQNRADHGCAILMEVQTGAVKAIANLKRYEDNTCREAENYAVNEFSDPGSTYKLISAMALLEDGFINPEDTVDIEWGRTSFGPLTMVDAHESYTRKLSFRQVFEQSSNVGIAKSVYKSYNRDPAKFMNHAFRLGLQNPLKFDIHATRKPRLKSSDDREWSGSSLPFMSIGYEMELSAMQILTVYNAVANGGKMMQPYLVKEVKEFGKSILKTEPGVINGKICSDRTLEILRSLLEGVVENGTARNLKGLSYKVAGKTGTAQIALNSKGYDKSSHKASFVGYFPADKPRYSCIVVVNAPKAGIYYGGSVAGPVFREIADKVYSTSLDLHSAPPAGGKKSLPAVKSGYRQDVKYVLNNLGISSHLVTGKAESEWVRAGHDVRSIDLREIVMQKDLVPDVSGMGLRDAVYLLENRGLRVRAEGYGKVVWQSLPPGSRTQNGGIILIRLNS